MLLGLAMVTVPIAPAALYIFQRSAAEPKCACSGPGSDFGVDETYTTIAPLRFTPVKSSMLRSGILRP